MNQTILTNQLRCDYKYNLIVTLYLIQSKSLEFEFTHFKLKNKNKNKTPSL